MLKKHDMIIFAFVLLLLCIFLPLKYLMSEKGERVMVYVDTDLVSVYDINDNIHEKIMGTDNISLELVIEDNTVYVRNSNCPDALCERQGIIGKANESIICLPGKIVISIDSDTQSEYDSISR